MKCPQGASTDDWSCVQGASLPVRTHWQPHWEAISLKEPQKVKVKQHQGNVQKVFLDQLGKQIVKLSYRRGNPDAGDTNRAEVLRTKAFLLATAKHQRPRMPATILEFLTTSR